MQPSLPTEHVSLPLAAGMQTGALLMWCATLCTPLAPAQIAPWFRRVLWPLEESARLSTCCTASHRPAQRPSWRCGSGHALPKYHVCACACVVTHRVWYTQLLTPAVLCMHAAVVWQRMPGETIPAVVACTRTHILNGQLCAAAGGFLRVVASMASGEGGLVWIGCFLHGMQFC